MTTEEKVKGQDEEIMDLTTEEAGKIQGGGLVKILVTGARGLLGRR